MNDVDLQIGASTSAAKAGLAELRNYGQKAHADLASIFARTFVVTGLIAATKSLIDYGDRVYDLGQRFGVSTDALQKFGNAAEKEGSSLQGVAMGFNKLVIAQSKALGGSAEMIRHFSNLGITIEDLRKLSPEELMLKLGKSTMEAADTVAILGRNGLELRPVLKGLADGTVELGTAIDAVNIKRLADASDAFKDLSEKSRLLAAFFVGPIVEGINKVGDAFEELKVIGVGTWNAIRAAATGDIAGFKAAVQSQADALSGALSEQRRAAREARRNANRGAGGTSTLDEPAGDIDSSSPASSRGTGGGRSTLQSLDAELAKLNEQHEVKQRTAAEQLEALAQQREELERQAIVAQKIDEFGDKAILDDKEEAALRRIQVDLAKNQLEIDKAQDTLQKEQLVSEKELLRIKEQILAVGERQYQQDLSAARTRNETAAITAEGKGSTAEIDAAAASLYTEYVAKIKAAADDGNQALVDALYAQYAALSDKLVERAHREGYGISPGTDATQRALAAGITGIGYNDLDTMEATDEYTGIVDQKRLRELRLKNAIGSATDQSKFGTGAVQGGSAVPRRSVAEAMALQKKILRLSERQRAESDRATRAEGRARELALNQELAYLQRGDTAGLAGLPGTPEYAAAQRGRTVPVAGPNNASAVAPLNPQLVSMLQQIVTTLQGTQVLIKGPPGTGG